MAPTISVGSSIPDGTLYFLDDKGDVQNVSVHSLVKGKKVILFGVPGAFTPTCSLKHVPGFIDKAGDFKNKGVQEFLCISVNDPFVINSWCKTYPENCGVRLLADGSAKYIQALGLELDLTDKGMGIRSKRFALFVDNLVVKIAKIESGGELTVSSAEEMIKAIDALK